jgi:predicted DNA binding protein
MRYVTMRVRHADGRPFHPLWGEMAEHSAITPGPIRRVEMLNDGTGISFVEVRDGLADYREILETSEYAIEYAVTGDDSGFVYKHFHLDELSRRMLSQRRDSELMIEMPMQICPNGSVEVQLVGDESRLNTAFDDVPSDVEFELVEMGEYEPDTSQLFDQLTDRQQEILALAVEKGYYENPRRTTHDGLAGHLDLSPATVGEHLRKVEARVLTEIVTTDPG